jgi:hypothetical protein
MVKAAKGRATLPRTYIFAVNDSVDDKAKRQRGKEAKKQRSKEAKKT